MDFSKPTIEYAELWPVLAVYGVACLGVLVEAFLPRGRRFGVQTLLAAAYSARSGVTSRSPSRGRNARTASARSPVAPTTVMRATVAAGHSACRREHDSREGQRDVARKTCLAAASQTACPAALGWVPSRMSLVPRRPSSRNGV